MKKKVIVSLFGIFALFLSVLFLIGCEFGSKIPSDKSYWFSNSKEEFIKYDEEKNNLEQAGSYWHFTLAKDADITLKIRINVDDFKTCAYLYKNDELVKSEIDTGIYSRVYKLSLKKGDKLKLHAFWLYSIETNEEGFNIEMLTIAKDGNEYVIKEFDKSKKIE
ncbi:MAG TPA: hypothetical protein GX012_00975 [Acholeplasma sp.]|jgi:hypothetical protein|nr:hypothetical protein [Acholeplasma sp.]